VPRGEEDEVGVAMDGEDGHYPRTINEELVELGWLNDDVDDMGDAAALLFGSNAAPINLEEAAPASGVAASNDNDSLASSSTGKRRSAVCGDFDEVIENIDGKKHVIGVCKFCKARLSANLNAGTNHLLRHQKSCMKKADHAAMVQTRLALNPDGSYRN